MRNYTATRYVCCNVGLTHCHIIIIYILPFASSRMFLLCVWFSLVRPGYPLRNNPPPSYSNSPSQSSSLEIGGSVRSEPSKSSSLEISQQDASHPSGFGAPAPAPAPASACLHGAGHCRISRLFGFSRLTSCDW